MHADLAVKQDGRILGLRVNMVSDNGAFYADAQPSKFRAGLFHVVTGSYDYPAAHIVTQGAYTNKAPGGVAYRCSFRITEASFLIERLVQNAAYELNMDPADFRMKNFIKPEQCPYHTPTGFVYDSGQYAAALQKALDDIGYAGMPKEKEEARKEGKLLGVGIASFTEAVGAGPSKDYDIAGLTMFDSAELRVHPTGKAILKLGTKAQGQGHETTYAQIVANELGIPASDIAVREGDTDNTPYGLGTYASRSTPTSGAAAVVIARKLREKARTIAGHMLEASKRTSVGAGPLLRDRRARSWCHDPGRRSRRLLELPRGHRARPRGRPLPRPTSTYPFGSYAVVVEVDEETGVWKVRRMVAVDDCGAHQPMIVEGQICGGLAEGFAMSSMQFMTFDEDGNCIGSNLMDYLIPTAWETPRFELDETVTPSPHHPIGAKGVGESATVGSPAAYVNAVIDALLPYGIRNIDMPVTPARVWAAIQEAKAR
jgi:carbon-monoxide dehydrogenase large subunit